MVEKHRARLHAELTRLRISRGYSSTEELRRHLEGFVLHPASNSQALPTQLEIFDFARPRWMRINTLKGQAEELIDTSFAECVVVPSLEKLSAPQQDLEGQRGLYIDRNIPNLFAMRREVDISNNEAYLHGSLILQDKASCFPAYLLDPDLDGICVDACAAPGNKTTHLAAILLEKSRSELKPPPTIHACERDKDRALVLTSMVRKAGAQDQVKIHAGQDFLKIDPDQTPWCEATSLLLDPSCSGSGMLGRDDSISITLPTVEPAKGTKPSGKRKRMAPEEKTPLEQNEVELEMPASEDSGKLSSRLAALSAFQLKLLLHAFKFPKARKIAYSTCSVFAEENEQVVVQASILSTAEELGWQILPRENQVQGSQTWPVRGDLEAVAQAAPEQSRSTSEVIAQACIRCEKGTFEGTQGFFVAAFVKGHAKPITEENDDEWTGFSDA